MSVQWGNFVNIEMKDILEYAALSTPIIFSSSYVRVYKALNEAYICLFREEPIVYGVDGVHQDLLDSHLSRFRDIITQQGKVAGEGGGGRGKGYVKEEVK